MRPSLAVAFLFIALAGCSQFTGFPRCGDPMMEDLYGDLTYGAEKGQFGVAAPPVPDDWFFPAQFRAYGGDPNITDPGPDNATLLELGNRGGELRRQRADLPPEDAEGRSRIDAEIERNQAEYLRVDAEYHRLRMAIRRAAGEGYIANFLIDHANDAPAIRVLQANAQQQSLDLLVENEAAMEWLLARPYVVNVYNHEHYSVACAF